MNSNTEIENTSFDFNTLNYQEESINAYDLGHESEWQSDFTRNVSEFDSLGSDFSLELFLQYQKNKIVSN